MSLRDHLKKFGGKAASETGLFLIISITDNKLVIKPSTVHAVNASVQDAHRAQTM